MSANIEQIKAMLERAGKTNLLQKQKVDLDKERLQLEATVNIEKIDKSLEEAAYLFSRDTPPGVCGQVDVINGFIAGAKWQKEQTTAEIAHCINCPVYEPKQEWSEKDKLARSAASEWCQCFKCDGLINETKTPCVKPNWTCWKWYDAYRAAKIALGKVKLAQNTEVKIVEEDEK